MPTLRVKTNERFYREMQYKDANDTGIDITGYSIDLGINARNGTAIANLSIGSGITITTANIGKFTVEVTDTSSWPIGIAKSDIVLTNASSEVAASETFNIEIIEGITSV